jgi:protein-S-isoprenylcysteine O-methyltransferase Ste14
MSKCQIRLILWLSLTITTVVGGTSADIALRTVPFNLCLRLPGLAGMALAYLFLRRTGRLLSRMGEPQEWGCTSKLVTTDIYACLRHPHHLSMGLFMTSLALLIGHIWSFLLISVPQWIWIFAFLYLVEEPELMVKFGHAYEEYREKVPMAPKDVRGLVSILGRPLPS